MGTLLNYPTASSVYHKSICVFRLIKWQMRFRFSWTWSSLYASRHCLWLCPGSLDVEARSFGRRRVFRLQLRCELLQESRSWFEGRRGCWSFGEVFQFPTDASCYFYSDAQLPEGQWLCRRAVSFRSSTLLSVWRFVHSCRRSLKPYWSHLSLLQRSPVGSMQSHGYYKVFWPSLCSSCQWKAPPTAVLWRRRKTPLWDGQCPELKEVHLEISKLRLTTARTYRF